MDDDDLENALAAFEREHAEEQAMDLAVAKMLLARGSRVALPYNSLSTAMRRVCAESIASADEKLRAAEAALTDDTFKMARDSVLTVFALHKRLRRDHETAVARGDQDASTRVAEELRKYDDARNEVVARLHALNDQLSSAP